MKKKLILTFLLLLLLNQGCYTRLNYKGKTDPYIWQKQKKHELDHSSTDVECFKWDYYYKYPYWLSLSSDQCDRTGFSKMLGIGGKIFYGIKLTFSYLDFFDFSEKESEKSEKKAKLPGKRDHDS
jgi:hypothetical protein